MLKKMIEYRRLAHRARSRIKAWKVTETEAISLACEIQPAWFPMTIHEILLFMRAGDVRVLGAKVVVK